MSGPERRILLATVSAPHGVRGELRVKAFTADSASLRRYGPLAAEDGRRFEIEHMRPAGGAAVVKFRGVDDRTAAEALRGLRLFVQRDRLPVPDDEEYYHADLVGLAAETENGEPLGTLVAIHDFGAGDILEIAPPHGASLLVPFTREAVPAIDMAAGRVVIAPPPEAEDDSSGTGGSTE